MKNLFLVFSLFLVGACQSYIPAYGKEEAHVSDFGALGNDTDDDTPAFLEAIATGKNVTLKTGEYYLSDNLVLQNNQHFMGEGIDKTIIHFTGGSTKFAFTMRAGYQRVGRLTIDCAKATDRRGNGILFEGANWGSWEDVKIIRCQDVGVKYVDQVVNVNPGRWNYGKGILHIHGGVSDGSSQCTGIVFDAVEGANYSNINIMNTVVINYCKNGVIVGETLETSHNNFRHLTVTGSGEYGVDVQKSRSFVINSGWLEDNVLANMRIGNASGSVYVTASTTTEIVPGGLDLTPAYNRSIVVHGNERTASIGTFFAAQTFIRRNIPFGPTITPDLKQANTVYLEFNAGDTQDFFFGIPEGLSANSRIIIHMYNKSGGAIGDATWHEIYSTTWDNAIHKPGDGEHTVIEFYYHAGAYARFVQVGLNGPLAH